MSSGMDRVDSPFARREPRIVALGGGHGLYATLSAARRLTHDITAVVTVSDDGGSSGRIRSELGIVPPGDLRMALAALASDSPRGRMWATAIQHRLGGSGGLAGHPIGNLILAGLTDMLADPVTALDEMGRMLGITGRVLPMCPIPLQIEADVSGLESDPRMSRVIRGQVALATTPGKVRRVRLHPGDPPATRQAVDAIMAADLVVLGPGSWFTSVIPHVLVPELFAALQQTRARKALILNLASEPGETAGFSAERHLHVLSQHAPEFGVHDIVVESASADGTERDHLTRAAALFNAQVQFADVARPGTHLHDPAKLSAVLDRVRTSSAALGTGTAAGADVESTVRLAAGGGHTQHGSQRGDATWR